MTAATLVTSPPVTWPVRQSVDQRGAVGAGVRFKIRPRSVTNLTGVFASLSFGLQILLNEQLGLGWHIALTAFGMFCAALSAILPMAQEAKYEQTLLDAKDAAQLATIKARTEVQDGLAGITDVLASAVCAETEPARLEAKAALKRAAVECAAHFLGPDRTRACFFDYKEGPPATLYCNNNWTGRASTPSRYDSDTRIGKSAIAMVARRQSDFREDLDADPPAGWPASKDYKTYIAVTVEARQWIFGMLTLDSMAAGDLTESDVLQMKLIANWLAVGLAAGLNGEGEVI